MMTPGNRAKMISEHRGPVPSGQPPPGDIAESAPLSMAQLARLSGIAEADIGELVDYGVLAPVGAGNEPQVFRADGVALLRRADHLRQDLALDGHAFALAVMLLGQVSDLEAQLRTSRTAVHAERADGAA